MTDRAVYVRFSRIEATDATWTGTRVIATRGFKGPKIAHLEFGRILSGWDEQELDAAVRAGAAVDAASNSTS